MVETVALADREAINLTIHYEDAGDGWVMATIPEVPGAISQGRTRAEARANVIDALQTVLTPDDQLTGTSSAADDELLTLTVAE
jgi:predicted RNase H-like HicB family nuclease